MPKSLYMTSTFYISLVCLICLSCTSVKLVQPGNSQIIKINTVHDSQQRSYLLHLPAGYKQTQTYPLVVAIHGAFSSAHKFELETGFSALADSAGFIVVYPQGQGAPFGLFRHWNAGHCCGRAQKKHRNDVDFIKQVIDSVSARWHVNRQRIYMTGFSNGGMLVHAFAQKYNHLLAAIAPLAAPINSRADTTHDFPQLPAVYTSLPVLMMHGRLDDSLPFDGGVSPRRGGTQEFASALQSCAYWAHANGYIGKPDTTNLPQVIQYSWTRKDCCITRLLALKQWKHQWPGRYFTAGLPPAHPMYRFDGTARIWDFFCVHELKN